MFVLGGTEAIGISLWESEEGADAYTGTPIRKCWRPWRKWLRELLRLEPFTLPTRPFTSWPLERPPRAANLSTRLGAGHQQARAGVVLTTREL